MDQQTDDLQLGKTLMQEQYPNLDVTNIEVIQGGGIKTVWKVETASANFCLKRIRKSLPIVKFTSAAQDYLHKKGALVAGIVPTKDQGLYFEHEGYGLVLYEWIDGSDLIMEEIEEHAYHGLTGLAQFHKDSVGFVPPPDCQTYNRMGKWPAHYQGLVDELKEWVDVAKNESTPFNEAYLLYANEMIELAERATQLLNESSYYDWVNEIGEHGYMCHQDYGKGNALYTDQGVYVLDLDNLTYDIPIRDIRKLITKRIEEIGEWKQEDIQNMVNHYTTILPLTEEQIRILYIDMLFPHQFYGVAKNPFKKGKVGEAKKITKAYRIDSLKTPVLDQLL